MQPQPAPQAAPAPQVQETPSKGDELKEEHIELLEQTGELTLQDALQMYDDARTYVDTGLRVKWDNYFRVYRGERVIRNYEGIADPVIRESHTIIETLVANIASGNPKFHFRQTLEEQAADTEILNGMLDYYLIVNQMELKNQEWVRDMLLYGTGILHVSWVEGKPFIENIPLRDFFIDPTATGLVKTISPARYAGHAYLADRKDLESRQIYSAEEDKMVPFYKNLDTVGFDTDHKGGAATSGNKTMDKAFKDMFNTSTLGDEAAKRQIHVIRLYDLQTGKMVEIGNRKDFIYYADTWCQRKEQTDTVTVDVGGEQIQIERKLDEISAFLPYAALRDYVDTSLFYADGEMSLLINDAELLNDYEAMEIDNNAYQNTPMYWVDPQFADLAPEIETIPGAVYPIPRNAMGALERPQLTQDLDQKKQGILDRMRRATAADEAIQGVSQDKSRTTATEVQSQITQSQTRFSTKISNLQSEGYAQLGEVIFKLIQIFVTRKTAVRIVGPQGVHFKDFDPYEYNGEYEAYTELDSTINQRKQEVGMKMNQVFQLFTGDPSFNNVEVKRWMAQFIDPDLTDDKFNAMLAPPQPPKPQEENIVSVSYKDLEPWGRVQVQKELGWDPDPSLEGDMHNRMLSQAVEGADLMDPATTKDGNVVPGLEHHQTSPQPAMPPEGMPKPQVAAKSA